MMKLFFVVLFCASVLVYHGQKIVVLNESGFKHNYVVSDLVYIEDLKDTTRLNYIATLRISDPHNNVLKVVPWFDLAQIKAKQLGANSFYASNYDEDSTYGTLELKLYFAGKKFLDLNNAKRDTNQIFVFNQVRLPDDTVSFEVGDKHKYFRSKTYYKMTLKLKEGYTLFYRNNYKVTTENIVFKKTKPSRFFVLPSKKNSQMDPLVGPIIPGGIVTRAIIIGVYMSKFYELDYTTGRLLKEVYK